MPAPPAVPDRRELLLEAALELVAVGGLGAVTHRAVEKRAGVPHGTVTYWFDSRDGLLAALVDHVVGRSEQTVADFAGSLAERRGADDLDLPGTAREIAAWIDGDRSLHLARLELELAAIRDPDLRERMREGAEVFWALCAPIAGAIGSGDPAVDGRALVAMVDGLLLDRLAHPAQSLKLLEAALARLLDERG